MISKIQFDKLNLPDPTPEQWGQNGTAKYMTGITYTYEHCLKEWYMMKMAHKAFQGKMFPGYSVRNLESPRPNSDSTFHRTESDLDEIHKIGSQSLAESRMNKVLFFALQNRMRWNHL